VSVNEGPHAAPEKTKMEQCAEFERLQSEVRKILHKLTELTTAQLNAFQAGDRAGFARLDKELENTVGEKERAIGAMAQHAGEHGCQLV
jgi:hypothetical protein